MPRAPKKPAIEGLAKITPPPPPQTASADATSLQEEEAIASGHYDRKNEADNYRISKATKDAMCWWLPKVVGICAIVILLAILVTGGIFVGYAFKQFGDEEKMRSFLFGFLTHVSGAGGASVCAFLFGKRKS